MKSGIIALISMAALALPTAPATSRSIEVALCGQPGVMLSIPIDGAPVDDERSCRHKACHVGCEPKRRTRPVQSTD